MSANYAIWVEHLEVTYRNKKGANVQAVRDLSFQVEPGEIVGFLGPNGAGKSSTIKTLMGFVEPAGGTAEIFGLPAGTIEARALCGYLPEVALYYPYLTPVETLTLYGELQGLRGATLRKEVLDLLELVGLSHALKKQNRQLSKGMLQRVGIAQSLLGNPKLLVLDEVTSGLDPVGRQELRNLLKSRQEQGTTLFFSSHELAEVDMLCNRILMIHLGVLIDERNIDTLKTELRQHVIRYRGEVILGNLTTNNQRLEPGIFEATFANQNNLIEAMQILLKNGIEILDLQAQDGSLEDYFVNSIRSAA
jgi:ABC-2 type transport system ATP-binding protein